MKRYSSLLVAGAAALIAFDGRCQTVQSPRPTMPAGQTISGKGPVKSGHIRGNPEAPVTLEEFGDFECPSCANLATFLDQLIKEYHPRVRLIFHNFPLAMHSHARDAALAAEAAGLQGRFWEMHDMLFKQQAGWSGAAFAGVLFDSYAETLGLDLNQFRRDLKSDKVSERIEADQARVKSLGIKIAPALFIDGREMGTNDRTPEGVRKLVDEAVRAKSSRSKRQ
jgi:protein-disulfide isomerase